MLRVEDGLVEQGCDVFYEPENIGTSYQYPDLLPGRMAVLGLCARLVYLVHRDYYKAPSHRSRDFGMPTRHDLSFGLNISCTTLALRL